MPPPGRGRDSGVSGGADAAGARPELARGCRAHCGAPRQSTATAGEGGGRSLAPGGAGQAGCGRHRCGPLWGPAPRWGGAPGRPGGRVSPQPCDALAPPVCPRAPARRPLGAPPGKRTKALAIGAKIVHLIALSDVVCAARLSWPDLKTGAVSRSPAGLCGRRGGVPFALDAIRVHPYSARLVGQWLQDGRGV